MGMQIFLNFVCCSSSLMYRKCYLPISTIPTAANIRDNNKRLFRYREGREKVLITTNVCARGIDIEQVTVVINFDLPTVHGSGIVRRNYRILLSGLEVVTNFKDIFENDVLVGCSVEPLFYK